MGYGEQVVFMAAGALKRTSFGVLPMLVFFVLLLVSLYLDRKSVV